MKEYSYVIGLDITEEGALARAMYEKDADFGINREFAFTEQGARRKLKRIAKKYKKYLNSQTRIGVVESGWT